MSGSSPRLVQKRVILCVVLCAAKNTGNVLIEVTLSPRVEGGHCHARYYVAWPRCPLTLGRSGASSQHPSAQCNLYRAFPLCALLYTASLLRAPSPSLASSTPQYPFPQCNANLTTSVFLILVHSYLTLLPRHLPLLPFPKCSATLTPIYLI